MSVASPEELRDVQPDTPDIDVPLTQPEVDAYTDTKVGAETKFNKE